ncbi:Os10g0525101 [Oryza sativa Japonica Group]|uniref:Os10g0525101 protein n=1 Tax=Oryza sativa subsp. japonica TaxID=39947 RepID=A0A0N7KS39_ORYSJ|nr:Os10g0525101 [Oryza sativa Japonica Group]
MNLVRISCLESYCTQKVHLNFKCLITHKMDGQLDISGSAYSVVCLGVGELVGPVTDELVHEPVDDLDPLLEHRLGADVEEPRQLPERVEVAEHGELAGVVERRGEAAPLAGAVQRVEVLAERDGEDGVHLTIG